MSGMKLGSMVHRLNDDEYTMSLVEQLNGKFDIK